MGLPGRKRASTTDLIKSANEAGDPPEKEDGEEANKWYKSFTGLDLPSDGTRKGAWDAAIKNFERALEFDM